MIRDRLNDFANTVHIISKFMTVLHRLGIDVDDYFNTYSEPMNFIDRRLKEIKDV